MATPRRAHRASAQRRRQALLDAAAELAAELGAGAVTHRAVAARAGVPLSTTSYFFASIDDLVNEAMRGNVRQRVDQFDAAEQVWVLDEGDSASDLLERVTDALHAIPPAAAASQVETMLAASRNEELAGELSRSLTRLVERCAWQLTRSGASRAEDTAWALMALADGSMLHRLAGVDTDHHDRLSRGIRLLLAAATLDDETFDGLLARLERGSGRGPADGAQAASSPVVDPLPLGLAGVADGLSA